MRDKVNDFLDKICSHIRCKSAHNEIRTELMGHIEEMQNDGITIEKALSSMGDCAEIGAKLDKQHRPQIDWLLIGLVGFISIVGILMMRWGNDPRLGSFERYILWAGIGVAIAIGLMFFDYTKFEKLALPLYFFSTIFILFGIFRGARINGAVWIQIGSINISTSITIVPFLMSFVGFMNRFRAQGLNGVFKLIILGAISVFMIMLVPSTSNALILLFSYAVLLFVSVNKNLFEGNMKLQKRFLYAGCLLSLGVIAVFVTAHSYRIDRILNFFTRFDSQGANWQNIQLKRLLSISKWFGNIGLVDGYDPHNFLPGLTTDLALANVIITFGWVVGIALIFAIISLIVRLFTVTRKIKNSFGFYITLAICVALSTQFIISVLLNLGMFPIISLSLPFVSYGGIAYVCNMILIGLMLSVWRRNNILEADSKQPCISKIPIFEYADGKLIVNLKRK